MFYFLLLSVSESRVAGWSQVLQNLLGDSFRGLRPSGPQEGGKKDNPVQKCQRMRRYDYK